MAVVVEMVVVDENDDEGSRLTMLQRRTGRVVWGDFFVIRNNIGWSRCVPIESVWAPAFPLEPWRELWAKGDRWRHRPVLVCGRVRIRRQSLVGCMEERGRGRRHGLVSVEMTVWRWSLSRIARGEHRIGITVVRLDGLSLFDGLLHQGCLVNHLGLARMGE